jgi:RimJ/RimL family protein N-acetyltransferase
MTPTLETARLWLRPIGLHDAAQIQAVFPQWDVVQFLASSVPWPYPPDGAATYLERVLLPEIERGEHWSWSLRPKSEPDTLIGVIGLMASEDNNRGFWLDPRWRGQGLMTEACDAVNDFWFDVLKRPVLRVPKAVANVRSRRVSERQGMRRIGQLERDYVAGRLPAELWEITADEWRRRRGSRSASRPDSAGP